MGIDNFLKHFFRLVSFFHQFQIVFPQTSNDSTVDESEKRVRRRRRSCVADFDARHLQETISLDVDDVRNRVCDEQRRQRRHWRRKQRRPTRSQVSCVAWIQKQSLYDLIFLVSIKIFVEFLIPLLTFYWDLFITK